MDKKDLIPACLMSVQHDPSYRATLKAAMPVETHQVFESVERDGMFLPNGMLTLEAHAFIKNLNAVLPVVEATLATHGDEQITMRASNYRNGVESRRSAHEPNLRAPQVASQLAAIQPIQPTPSIPQMLKTASKAAANFARSGFATTDPKTLASREATCRGCDMWDAQAVNGTGRCRKCGCSTWAKLRMASEKCPLGKW